MVDERLPSLSLVLDVLRAGRDERRAHFEALDEKAGLALGFGGVLITLSAAIVQPWRLVGVTFAAASLGFALASFWPRKYEVLDNVRDYLAAQPEQTELVLVDTLGLMNARTDRAMGKKAQRLKLALLTLAVAAISLGVGVVLHPGGVHG